MSPQEARHVLLLYRPGSTDASEPQTAEALELAGRDPELGRWFEQHRAFQKVMRAKFRQIEPPAHLKTSLLIRGSAEAKVATPAAWWGRPLPLAVAAAVVVLLGIAALWLQPARPDRFANFRTRMVSTALREYRMDIVTNDMRQVRQFMAERGAPGDYALTPGLEKLQLTGGGYLQWRSNPVAMVCFDRGDNQMLFLFVMRRSALKDPPAATPQPSKVTELQTVSWTRGEYTYVLAGPEDPEFPRRYL